MDEKKLVINKIASNMYRIALLNGENLEKFYVEKEYEINEHRAGNIYKAIIKKIEPSMQVAFVDLGNGKNGFLHINDVNSNYLPDQTDSSEILGHKINLKNRPSIEKCLSVNQKVIVQITKESIGNKSPVVTTYISIPGRFYVFFPYMKGISISQKITSEKQKKLLIEKTKNLIKKINKENHGFLIRTAAKNQTKSVLQKDLNYIIRLWNKINSKKQTSHSPQKIYTEPDLITKIIRDTFGQDFDSIITDDKDKAKNIYEFLKLMNPRKKTRIYFYKGDLPLFYVFNIEKQIDTIYQRKVNLPSGGNIVIDPTEALVAIDVNSGNAYQDKDSETKNFLVNKEAADIISGQIKLRDLGGIIVCDFIDMQDHKHKKEIEKQLRHNFKYDSAKIKISGIGDFGILIMQRQHIREPHKKILYSTCPICAGSGVIKKYSTLINEIMRKISVAAESKCKTIKLNINSDLAEEIFNLKKTEFINLEKSKNLKILIEIDKMKKQMEYDVYVDDRIFKINELQKEDISRFLVEVKSEKNLKKSTIPSRNINNSNTHHNKKYKQVNQNNKLSNKKQVNQNDKLSNKKQVNQNDKLSNKKQINQNDKPDNKKQVNQNNKLNNKQKRVNTNKKTGTKKIRNFLHNTKNKKQENLKSNSNSNSDKNKK